MKNQFLLMISFCLISNAAYSMSIDLDEASKANLLEKVKAENIQAGNWPVDVAVRLETFEKRKDENEPEARYFVQAVGSYSGGFVVIEKNSGEKIIQPVRLGKRTKGFFSKQELNLLGVQLPEQN